MLYAIRDAERRGMMPVTCPVGDVAECATLPPKTVSLFCPGPSGAVPLSAAMASATVTKRSSQAGPAQIRDVDLFEAHSERVDPEAVSVFGIACGDVSSNAVGESELAAA